jgi:putative DNA methylase
MGKAYIPADRLPECFPPQSDLRSRIDTICRAARIVEPTEPIVNDAKGALFCVLYGLKTWKDVFNPRQMLCLLSFASSLREASDEMAKNKLEPARAKALLTYLAVMIDKLADFNSLQCTWNYTDGERVRNSFSRQTLAMVWDSAEVNPFNDAGGGWLKFIGDVPAAIEQLTSLLGTVPPTVQRGSALQLPIGEESFSSSQNHRFCPLVPKF